MTSAHLVAMTCCIVSGACFLLDAFGIHAVAAVALLPLGLLFFVAAYGACHHHHH